MTVEALGSLPILIRMTISRRELLGRGAVAAGAALGLGSLPGCLGGERPTAPPSLSGGAYGPLVPDADDLLDLPRRFRYRVLSEKGARVAGSAGTPARADGMAAFAGRRGSTVLVRNHELSGAFGQTDGPQVEGRNPYSADSPGGTTALVVGPDRRVLEEYVTSSGTRANCAGGRTPWGTWLTCEENLDDGHGFVFEVSPDDPENDLSRQPIRAMGMFRHEAAAIDPSTGIVYLTEDNYGPGELPDEPGDEGDEAGAFLYRYVPTDRRGRPGALQAGGSLEVMAVAEDVPSRNADLFPERRPFAFVWKPVGSEDPKADALVTDGAARFNRLEGACFAAGALWFDDTEGGDERKGQIFRYRPGAGTLELFFEGRDDGRIDKPDNITITPWGDLWLVEDGDGDNRVVGVTPDGSLYEFASNRASELAGPTFSPDGRTFFVNMQAPGLTFAVWGPFARPSARAGHAMSLAAAPEGMRPRISGQLGEAARALDMSPWEAAAFDRLGVRLG